MPLDPGALPDDALAFLRERHLATLTTARADGTPHVVPVGFTFEPGARLVRVITFASSRKAANVGDAPGARVAVCQVDGARWLTLEGPARLRADAASVRAAEEAYAARYRPPHPRDDRVVIEVAVDRAMGSRRFTPSP